MKSDTSIQICLFIEILFQCRSYYQMVYHDFNAGYINSLGLIILINTLMLLKYIIIVRERYCSTGSIWSWIKVACMAKWNEWSFRPDFAGILGHGKAKAILGPGTTWANEMNFSINHAPVTDPITGPADPQSRVFHYATVAPESVQLSARHVLFWSKGLGVAWLSTNQAELNITNILVKADMLSLIPW